jgi:hypothetical protein
MIRKALLVIGLGFALVACASDDDGGGGSGDDALPKRGERDTDPTIVSATARCSCGGEVCNAGDPGTSHVRVRVDASDPMGASNLGTCAGTLGGATDQDSYSDGNNTGCYLYFKTAAACAPGQVHTVALTVSNETAGVTTASVKLTVSP